MLGVVNVDNDGLTGLEKQYNKLLTGTNGSLVRERAISEDAASQVTSCMQTVVSEGTGVGGAVDGYDVAGKTGTAERADENGGYLKENYMSSFMGFAPAQSPKVLCYITLDGTPSGSDAAAVPFQSIMANALDVLGIPHTK